MDRIRQRIIASGRPELAWLIGTLLVCYSASLAQPEAVVGHSPKPRHTTRQVNHPVSTLINRASDAGEESRGRCTGASVVPALVTVEAGPEEFVVRVTDQALLDEMIDICLGYAPQRIVHGELLTGNAGYNRDATGDRIWSWHLDEDTIGLADMAMELCDGIPSHVENGLAYWVETVGRYCPWSGRITAIGADTSLSGDIDVDGDVDLLDFAMIQTCLTGPDLPCYGLAVGCCAGDLNADANLDLHDYGRFQTALASGSP